MDQQLQAGNNMSVTLAATLGSDSSLGREPRATPASNLLDLPASELTAGQQEGAEPPYEHVRPTLLVVDDECDMLRSVHDLLRIDYRVVTYQRGADALDFLRSAESVHVILTDQRMPEMTGVEVLRQAMAIRPETTRLLFTAYSDVHTVIDAINQGHVFRYLSKPCDPEFLAAVVRQGVEHHDLIVEKSRLLADLRETNAKLIEANRLKGAFIEVASHELNTPITVVLGMLELWKIAQSQSASPVERQWVDRIGAAAGRLARTVERMLKLVRNRDFSQSLDMELIELEPVVRRAIEELSPYLELRRQTVTIDIEPDLGPLEVDSSKIADVLINL
ncbi:MAG TPA: hybrid sensor histidine kinase/response regulator, partial [Isosphaeraceae bacterium]|nr:hybrid sensor histidine kinase/response regulator [Isosphaeraceae bacterium]